ncbi:helix-turn-helix domain-containing protein [Scytonema sp. UIC 10036]|uniref:helix-turn-helix domain-containing protein n=1 Tax=Scytonema sp. UIC 10036 TaxID=2304196 RepID=UPI0012DAA115|nr:helix-turn-helix domain-containing protein [Scytonema sp. UIC 10036]MUG92179.1 helix-turn-helix domain-containing protein [Scytonema sp. UIC 10036]
MIKAGISLVQAAKYLQVEQSTLYIALQKGEIPTSRRNGRTIVTQGALLDYQARKRILL